MAFDPEDTMSDSFAARDALSHTDLGAPTRHDSVSSFRLNASHLTHRLGLVSAGCDAVPPNPIDTMMRNFVGLDDVKNQLSSYFDMFKLNALRVQYGLPARLVNTHMVFTGNPGTGKTSVARLLGRVFKHAGILPYGHVVETSPHDMFTSSQVGDEVTSMSKRIKAAMGGVLFIDEAHNFPEHAAKNSEFWRNGVATLMTAMAAPTPNQFSVVLAGYADGMKRLFQLELGLKSRFPNTVHFKDYNRSELTAIFERYASHGQFYLADGCHDMLMKTMHEMPHRHAENFGNARFVQNFFDETIKCVANRVRYLPLPTPHDISLITVFDINAALHHIQRQN